MQFCCITRLTSLSHYLSTFQIPPISMLTILPCSHASYLFCWFFLIKCHRFPIIFQVFLHHFPQICFPIFMIFIPSLLIPCSPNFPQIFPTIPFFQGAVPDIGGHLPPVGSGDPLAVWPGAGRPFPPRSPRGLLWHDVFFGWISWDFGRFDRWILGVLIDGISEVYGIWKLGIGS